MEKQPFRLNRKKFVQHVIGIEHHQISGCFIIEHSTGTDRYYFVKGRLLDIQRSEQEQEEPLTVSLGYAFLHKKSKGLFEPYPHLDQVENALLPKFSIFDAFWKGLQKHMPQTEIFSEINAVPRDGLLLAEQLEIPTYHNDALADLFLSLENPSSLQDIQQNLQSKWPNFCSYGDLYRVIWLLFYCNKLTQALPYINPIQEMEKQGTSSHEEVKQESNKPKDIVSFVQHEHQKRMGRDFYRFLGLKETANYSEIDTVGKKLLKTFNKIAQAKKLPKEEEQKLEELQKGTALVLTHLLDPEKREEYNQRKKSGRTLLVDIPTIHENSPKESPSKTKDNQYEQLIAEGKFQEAYPILKALREEDSSNPDVLCDLGWTLWNLKQSSKEAEEYIRLALTFNNRHIRSYTYLSEIYLTTNNHEMARKFLTVLVKLQPQNQKAKMDLDTISQPLEEKPQKGWFR